MLPGALSFSAVPLLAWCLVGALAAQAAAAPPSSPPAAPAAPSTDAPPSDPAVSVFTTAVGLLLVPVKADKTADYESVIAGLQAGFAASTDPAVRAVAAGWRVFKATEPDAKGNALYIHALLPVVPGTDYRPSLWLDRLTQDAPTELLSKYKDALAGSPTRLSLAEVASMAAAPVRK